MGLAGKDQLEGAHLPGNPPQALEIVEQQVRPLVGRHPPGKPQGQHVLVHAGVGLAG